MNIAVRVQTITKNVCGTAVDVLPASNITNNLGLDSFDRVELIVNMEEEFNIIIEDDEFEKLKTVQDMILLIENKIAAKTAR